MSFVSQSHHSISPRRLFQKSRSKRPFPEKTKIIEMISSPFLPSFIRLRLLSRSFVSHPALDYFPNKSFTFPNRKIQVLLRSHVRPCATPPTRTGSALKLRARLNPASDLSETSVREVLYPSLGRIQRLFGAPPPQIARARGDGLSPSLKKRHGRAHLWRRRSIKPLCAPQARI